MPLTPQDVRAKLFTSVRFKPGYDEGEVDAFLDQVETDLGQLYSRIDALTADLEIARSAPGSADAAPVVPPVEPDTTSFARIQDEPPSWNEAPSDADDGDGERRGQHAAPIDPAEQEESETEVSDEVAAPGAELSTVEPSDGGPTEEMLRRTLILAQRTADALITEARAEAETLVADARVKAEQIEQEFSLEHSTRQRDLQAEHDHLNGLVEQLRGFESEYRNRLRAYLNLQLRDLENSSPADPQRRLEATQQAALYGAPNPDVGSPDDPNPYGTPKSGEFQES